MPEIGIVVKDRYRILRELGRGGSGIVYLALDEQSDRTWAIKVADGKNRDFDMVRRSLMSGAHILKNCCHPCLPVIAEIMEEQDSVMMVMEYVEGRSLKEMLTDSMKREGLPLPVEDVILWARQICEVLYYLHTAESPVIYGDLKPGNVMVRPDGNIVLIDFGTVWLSAQGYENNRYCLGTPGYAAPEQYGSRQLGPWTDIYSLGATLHCLLTGRDPAQTPFCFPDILECCPQLEAEASARQRKMLVQLGRIIERCTRYSAAERYHSCKELADELAEIGGAAEKSVKKLCGRKVLLKLCFCTAILCGILAAGGSLLQKRLQNMEYAACIQQAEMSDDEEKICFLRRAVALNPYCETAYMELLDTLLEDGIFSDSDEKLMTELLYEKGEGRVEDNKACLGKNSEGYVIFSYRMGLACYYLTGESGSRIRAEGWLKTVADMDMEQIDLGIYEDKKRMWQEKTGVLIRFSSFYHDSLNRPEYTEDSILYEQDYLADIKILLEGAMEEQEDIELRMYQEIVMRILEGTGGFYHAGIDRKELACILETITDRLAVIWQNHGEGSEELKKQIEKTIEKAKKGMDMFYGESGGTAL